MSNLGDPKRPPNFPRLIFNSDSDSTTYIAFKPPITPARCPFPMRSPESGVCDRSRGRYRIRATRAGRSRYLAADHLSRMRHALVEASVSLNGYLLDSGHRIELPSSTTMTFRDIPVVQGTNRIDIALNRRNGQDASKEFRELPWRQGRVIYLEFLQAGGGVYDQYYKLLHYGMSGYRQCSDNMMENARFLRDGLRAMTRAGKPRFTILDHGDEGCLPVVTAMLNPECELGYDDVDLQHVLSQHHWYVGSYRMRFEHPLSGEQLPLFCDADAESCMFRIVVKSNLTRGMAEHLLESIRVALDFLDSIAANESPEFDMHHLRHKDQRRFTNHC